MRGVDGRNVGGEVVGGCAITVIGALLLAASLFLDRADDYFYEVAENHLIDYGADGPVLVGLIALALLLCLLSLAGPFRGFAPLLLVVASVACLALTVVAATDLGVHPTDAGDQSNSIAVGSILAIASAGLMVAGSLIAFGGAGRGASINSQP